MGETEDRSVKLTGSRRCQCTACGEYFASVFAFDKHRRGPWSARRCDTSGMVLREDGLWVTKIMPFSALRSAKTDTISTDPLPRSHLP